MIVKDCSKCGEWFLNKPNYRYCPLCGHDLVQIIRVPKMDI